MDDYILPFKMNKYNEYEWIINDKLIMKKMKLIHRGMCICYDNFGNWNILLFPHGFSMSLAVYPGTCDCNTLF